MQTNEMKNILIIEDSRTINNIIQKELEKFGFRITQAYTLDQARTELYKKKFDLIILDLHLPDGEGSELIANIQSLTKTKVVVLTSLQDENLREELFSYGILDYIIKDTNLIYSVGEIVKIIDNLQVQKQKKILIIDDSSFIIKQIKTILEPRNLVLKAAKTAKKGLQELYSAKYDLLILDMELPDLHGLEILNMIRKESRFLELPILVLSGNYTAEVVRNALKNGASDFLKKPFIFEEFILKIDMWLDYYEKENALKKKTKELAFINEHLEKIVEQKVAQLREKEKIMLQQSRHAQMGEMIAMIAHQWRQPLNVIGLSTSLLEKKINQEPIEVDVIKSTTQKIAHYVEYLSTTIDDFRHFFQPQNNMVVTDFEKITNKALSLIHNALEAKGIIVRVELHTTQPFRAFENEMIQVVLNLIQNSEEALLENKVENPEIRLIVDGMSLRVADNAGGINPKIIEKIFDPYFSTKFSKEGTGLGLYMSKIIVEDHCGGKLSVENIQDGAVFRIEMFED